MRSTSQLWFHIETAFVETQELCVRALAAQLAVEQNNAVPSVMRRTMVSGGGIAKDTIDTTSDDPRMRRATELARGVAFREENAAGPDLVALRGLVRKRLGWLKGKFIEVLGEHDVYYGMFPIVVHFDELIQIGTRGQAGRWEPLQGELYEVYNGGDMFFTILEERLKQKETHPIVLEIFYYCLLDGFRGAYDNDQKKLDDYKARLIDRIELKPVVAPATTGGGRSVELISFPWQYYAVALIAVIASYVLLGRLAAMSVT